MMDGAVMFAFKMNSDSHQLSVFICTSSPRLFLEHLLPRSCSPLPWHMRKTSFLRLRCQRLSSSYRPTTRQESKYTGPAKKGPIQALRSFMREHFAQPVGELHRSRILSGILKSVAVTLGVAMMPPWRSPINVMSKRRYRRKFIRIARKHPRVRKLISVVRRKRRGLQLMFNSLASAAFLAFIVWDIRNLSHDEPIDSQIQKTVREDPAAALSNAREELAAMLKDKVSRC